MKSYSIHLLLLSIICSPLHAAVKGLNTQAPIQIQSDKAWVEQINQQATHEGNVILTQGTHELRADKLIIKKDAKGRLSVIEATGKPATFKGLMSKDPEPVFATARTILYYPDKQLVVFQGSATLEHRDDKFKGPILSYQLDKQIISATAQSNERPTITIAPRQSTS